MSRGPGKLQRFVLSQLGQLEEGVWVDTRDLLAKFAAEEGREVTPALERSLRRAVQLLEEAGRAEVSYAYVEVEETRPARPRRPVLASVGGRWRWWDPATREFYDEYAPGRRSRRDGIERVETGWSWPEVPESTRTAGRRVQSVRLPVSDAFFLREEGLAEERRRSFDLRLGLTMRYANAGQLPDEAAIERAIAESVASRRRAVHAKLATAFRAAVERG
ncbi:MAG: hypothetical protein AB1679_12245 [Actinomycetota bacterium]